MIAAFPLNASHWSAVNVFIVPAYFAPGHKSLRAFFPVIAALFKKLILFIGKKVIRFRFNKYVKKRP
jgi:hypothetical protein